MAVTTEMIWDGHPICFWFLNGSAEGGRGDRLDARMDIRMRLALTLGERPGPTSVRVRRRGCQCLAMLPHRKHDRCKSVLISKKAPDVFLESACLSSRKDQTKGFHDTAIWLESSVVIRTSRVHAATSVRVSMLSNPFTRTSRKKPTSASCARSSASFASSRRTRRRGRITRQHYLRVAPKDVRGRADEARAADEQALRSARYNSSEFAICSNRIRQAQGARSFHIVSCFHQR